MFGRMSQVPIALQTGVEDASYLGIMHGFTDGTFRPNADISCADMTHFITQVQAYVASSSTSSSRPVTPLPRPPSPARAKPPVLRARRGLCGAVEWARLSASTRGRLPCWTVRGCHCKVVGIGCRLRGLP